MKIIKSVIDFAKNLTSGIAVIAIFIVLISAILMAIGCIAYFLLSISFPQYISFGWYWLRFIALGILAIVY